MIDWKKRVIKSRAKDVAGETLLAATYFQGRGSASAQILFGSLTGVGGALVNYAALQGRNKVLEKAKEGHNTPPGSLADGFPDAKGILAVTDRTLIAFGYHQGFFATRIKDPVARIPRKHMVGWSFKPGRIAALLNLAFDDGSTIGIELPVANKPAAFAATLEIPAME